MEILFLNKLVSSAVVIVMLLFISHIIKKKAKEISTARNLKKTRYFAIKRIISFLSLVLLLISLVFIWGINIKHLWLSMTGVLALIAVAFFAVWSLVGNILAGLIIYFTTPFKINDSIEVMPDGIKGKVLAINTFFTVLIGEDDSYINVPNSLFFQKYVRNIKSK